MKIIFTEGALDVLFLRGILVGILKAKDITSESIEIKHEFHRLIWGNKTDGVVRILKYRGEKVVIVSTGGKDVFPKIARGLPKFIELLEERHEEPVSNAIFVGDKDAESIFHKIKESLKNKLNEKIAVIVYNEHMEDVVLRIYNKIENKLDSYDREAYIALWGKASSLYKDLDTPVKKKKRKLSMLHTVFSPECFEPLFELICSKLSIREAIEISELKSFLTVFNSC